MKKLKLLLSFFLILVIAFASVACTDDIPDDSNEAKDFGDWTNWGLDDWATGKYEEFDPSQNYNKIDWSEDYPGYDSEITYDVSRLMKFFSSKHVQVFQAEKAVLGGKAQVEEGSRVGYLTDGSITYTITAEEECDVLVIGSFATYESKFGYPFEDVFKFTVNGKDADVGDSWITSTDGWTSFEESIIGEIHLTKGENILYFYSAVAKANVDYIKLVPRGELSSETMDLEIVYDYKSGLVIQAENTDYENATPQTNLNTGTGTVLSSLKDTTKIRFVIRSDEAKEVGFFVNSLIRVDSNNSGNANDRFTLKVNGKEVDLSSITITGVTHDGASWWTKEYSSIFLGKINLIEGDNKIEIVPSAEMNIDYFILSEEMVVYPSFEYKEDLRVEAEDAFYNLILRDGGSGQILGYDNKIEDPQIKFVVNSDAEREVELFLNAVIRVDADHSGRASDRFTLKVNGTDIDLSSITIDGVQDQSGNRWWTQAYNDLSFGKISLKKGVNVIELTTSKEMNIDYFAFNKKTTLYATFDYEENLKVEGESTTYSGLVLEEAASGKVLAEFKTSSSIKFIVNCDSEKQVEFIVNALIRVDDSFSSNASDRFTLKVNGTDIDLSSITIDGVQDQSKNRWWTQAYSDLSLGNISLKKGENVIEITSLSTDLNVDYFIFS